jgi:para-nitrobenzyl esterase
MTIVQTRSGRLQGEARDGLCVFKGIPYAAPPVGPLRWRAPEPVAPWSGVRAATTFGAAAPQTPIAAGVLAAFNVQEGTSEDCLYVNVWTPAVDGGRRPVMVWIHGGGFVIGSGAQSIYDGAELARRGDVVVITLNYRLGPLGFLRLAELTRGAIPSTGNEGLLDQVAALEWVRANVAAFGGDPDNVTIFGESAGGMSVTTLLALPAARGLFHKAIAQSGAGHSAYRPDAHAHVAERILAATGTARDASALRALTSAQLLAATSRVQASAAQDPSIPGLMLQPVVDGESLPELPIEAIARGSAPGVPLLAGSTREEWNLFALTDTALPTLSEAGLVERLARRVGSGAQPLIETYRKAIGERAEPATPRDLYLAIETDRCFRIPGVRLAEAQGAHSPSVYSYLFTWKSPLLNGLLGACHAVELGFVFGTLRERGVAQFCGAGPEAEALCAKVMDSWIAFARSGDPSCASLRWPRYTAADRATMRLGERCEPLLAPLDEERCAWQGVPDRVLGQP